MDLQDATAQLLLQGWRRLLVISGDDTWVAQRAQAVMAELPGDWLYVGDMPPGAAPSVAASYSRRYVVAPGAATSDDRCSEDVTESLPRQPAHCLPSAVRTLLGREFQHAVFDARRGFHAEALAALAGTLRAGSWLLLLVPEWHGWPQQADEDSLRWSEGAEPQSSPRFVRRLQRLMLEDPRVAVWRQHAPLALSPLPTAPAWLPDNSQQQQILAQLLRSPPGIQVLTAPRGRGKSALAGLLAARWPGRCLVTAPARVATDVLAQFAGEAFHFIAPDRLLAEMNSAADSAAATGPNALQPMPLPSDGCPPMKKGVMTGPAPQPPAATRFSHFSADWLLIDEAAAIPAPILQQLVTRFPRVLLTTTVQGYEGTGRGFLLKFCAALPECHYWRLDPALRWAADDPLEAFISEALLLDDRVADAPACVTRYLPLEQADWARQPQLMAAVYQLLTSAHYRTSPLDLRRMMDAPGQHFIAAQREHTVQGALWLVEEGGLPAALADAVWAGLRRPRGNLLAQSLAAHAGFSVAAQLRSRRISRIAVAAPLRGQGIGQQLVAHALQAAARLDYLSVSFGFTAGLWQFWQRCGFLLVRIGSQREASSGCYTAMAILPLSEAGHQLAQLAQRRLEREGYWLRQWLDDPALPLAAGGDNQLEEDDWRELAGFAWAHRPWEASLAALGRLVSQPDSGLPLLRALMLEKRSPAQICQQYGLSGRKALLAAWRQEAQQGLQTQDPQRASAWREWVGSLQ